MKPASEARISVVIATHERADLVLRALASVDRQTRPADEIVVVDDGSTDGTAERVRECFPEVRLILQSNLGVSAARNRGIAASSGEWIAFLDSDDEWQPEKLERQLGALAEAPEHRLCHSEEVWIRDGNQVLPRRKHRKHGGRIFRHCLALCAISPSAAVVHRDVFARVGVFDESLPACEDYDLWLRICWRYPVLLVDEPLVIKYGGHADQLSRRFAAMDRFRIAALEKLVADPELPAEQRQEALDVLVAKIAIYHNGAVKRGRAGEVELYRAKRDRYRSLGAEIPEE